MSKKKQSYSAKPFLRKDDVVKVIAGDDKGKTGKVLFVQPDKWRAIVEGVNIVHRHTKPNQTHPNGAIVKKEAPINMSNLMVLDPKSNEPTRVGRKAVDGKLKRYSKKSGEIID